MRLPKVIQRPSLGFLLQEKASKFEFVSPKPESSITGLRAQGQLQ